MSGSDTRATRCHALRVRLGGPADPEPIERRLGSLAGAPRLWIERVPAGADERAAARRRARELARPVDAEHGCRAVLLSYADGLSDLLLVADRAVVGRSALRRLADAAVGGGAVHAAVAGEPSGDGVRPRVEGPRIDAAPAWGLGDDRAGDRTAECRVTAEHGAPADPASWSAALAVVLARYEGRDEPVIVVFDADARGGVTPITVKITGDAGLGDLTERLAADLAAGPTTAPVTAEATVALAVASAAPDGRGGPHGPAMEYIPFLAPPYPLTITVGRDADGRPDVRLHYWLRSVAPEIAAQFARHLAHVHALVACSPATRAVDADLFDAPERRRVLALGRSSPPPGHTPRCLHDVFADRVAERPDAVALTDENVSITYRHLDRWSDRLAGALRAIGVGAGDMVGVCLPRSAELVAVLLAVLKAGGVYVPMDPAYPAERLNHILADSGTGVLVTTLDGVRAPAGVHVVTPGELMASAEDGPGRRSPGRVTPADPAYVIYTSGSTGRPKGVLVPHGNVVSLLDATRPRFALGPADVWTFFHSVAFDFSVWEIWGCLLTGGRLVIVPYWVSRSPEQFRDLLVATGVTVLSQTPSAFAQLLEAERAHPPALSVRLVVFGGEPLHMPVLLPWLDRYPESRCEPVNMFGITETTVHVTAQTVTRGRALAASRSVGRALPGWHVYVLDERRRPVPPGVPGEIYVGGAGVANGYLRRPGLTAERFLPDPFAPGRMYRTGDLGRFRPDGSLEHLGRLDDQISLRGFRIELDEIRSVLAECPGVAAAAVVARQDDPHDAATARIDAYVVLAGGSVRRVRERLARLLPDYMRPATVMVLPSLPLTAHGKVDVRALPAADSPRPDPDEGSTATGDALRDGLIGIWRQVLGSPVGPDDDFFELGGNSLLAIRIAAAMRDGGLPPLHPRTLYLNPTVRRLTEALRSSWPGHDTTGATA